MPVVQRRHILGLQVEFIQITKGTKRTQTKGGYFDLNANFVERPKTYNMFLLFSRTKIKNAPKTFLFFIQIVDG